MVCILKKYKIVIFLLIVLILVLVGNVVFNINKGDIKTKPLEESSNIYNKEVGVIKDKNINDILITDISCKIEDGKTKIKYVITNNRGEDVVLNDYKLIFKDKDNEIIGTVYGNVSNSIKPKDNLDVENYTTIDLSKAVKMEIEL